MYTFSTSKPRIVGIFTLAADTLLTLREFIETALADADVAKYLLVHETAADEVARLAIVGIKPGYTVYQTDEAKFFEFRGEDPTDTGDWIEVTDLTKLVPYRAFINNLSWHIARDSSIGDRDTGDLQVVSKLTDTVNPSAEGGLGSYGITIAANSERSFSGNADQLYVYSSAGTSVLLDLVFEEGR